MQEKKNNLDESLIPNIDDIDTDVMNNVFHNEVEKKELTEEEKKQKKIELINSMHFTQSKRILLSKKAYAKKKKKNKTAKLSRKINRKK